MIFEASATHCYSKASPVNSLECAGETVQEVWTRMRGALGTLSPNVTLISIEEEDNGDYILDVELRDAEALRTGTGNVQVVIERVDTGN